MNILKKRPLSLILCIMLGGFSLFIDFSIKFRLIFAVVVLLAFGATFIFKNLIKGREKISRVLIICFAISLLLSSLWSYTFFNNEYDGQNATIEGKIYSIDNSDSQTSIMTLKTEKIDGKRDHSTLLVYMDKSSATRIRLYDMISISAEFHTYSHDNSSDTKSYYVSCGYSGYLTDISDLNICENRVDKIDKFFNDIATKTGNILKKRTDFETGAFLSALLLGNRNDLDGNTRLNFSRIGISHILALSGMHLAILSAALNKFLTFLKLNKKYRIVITSISTIFYIILTGASPSVMRAGIMLIITGLLYLLSSKSDTITSLFISVTIILIFSPEAVYDLSLWLSAFATLGVIVFSEFNCSRETEDDEGFSRIIRCFRDGCMVSLFAFGTTFVFSALRFGTFSIVSIFSTILFAFILQILIYASILLLLIGWFIPIGAPIIWLSDASKELAEFISSVKWISVSTNFWFLKLFIILFTVVFFAFVFLKWKNKKIGIIAILVTLILSFGVGITATQLSRYDDNIIYSPAASGDSFLMKSDGEIDLIYSGKAIEDSAYDTAEFLADERVTYLDKLVFTSYSYSLTSYCKTLIDRVKTDVILIPNPLTKDEINIAEGLSEMLMLYGTDLKFYEDGETVLFGKYSYIIYGRNAYQYGVMPANVFVINAENSKYTYVSTCNYRELNTDSKMVIYHSENLFIGTLGNSNYYLFDMRLPEIKNIYFGDDGRISDSAFDYYEDKQTNLQFLESAYELYE